MSPTINPAWASPLLNHSPSATFLQNSASFSTGIKDSLICLQLSLVFIVGAVALKAKDTDLNFTVSSGLASKFTTLGASVLITK